MYLTCILAWILNSGQTLKNVDNTIQICPAFNQSAFRDNKIPKTNKLYHEINLIKINVQLTMAKTQLQTRNQ